MFNILHTCELIVGVDLVRKAIIITQKKNIVSIDIENVFNKDYNILETVG